MKRLIFFCVLLNGLTARSEEIVHTFDREFHNWASSHVDTFQFPSADQEFAGVTLDYLLECPESPGDCDPWDRLGHLYLRLPETDSTWTDLEIARIVTPYDITGGTYPGSCGWSTDLTDYQHYLRGEVILVSQIDTWIGGENGWLVTADFTFQEGSSEWDPVEVIPLWSTNGAVYGDPERPFTNWVPPLDVNLPADADSLKIRITTTGHGQGNTYNAAEFFESTHFLMVGSEFYSHVLWRDDCNQNPCSPQGGTWQYPRAGWCPGALVEPWSVSGFAFEPGEPLMVYYYPESYENLCRPADECYDGPPPGCADCDYNYNGHTQPYYSTMGQLVVYRHANEAVIPSTEHPRVLNVAQNTPNPFNPDTRIRFTTGSAGPVSVTVYNVQGERVCDLARNRWYGAGEQEIGWQGTDDTGRDVSTGVYFCRVESHAGVSTVKMLLVR